ncbi:uncharacterized protein [Ptychodera flava]|uniref:uncharacterized protein n=1 Tax=Ptychodera flava TaxID=63121 RepID=UPI00396AA517
MDPPLPPEYDETTGQPPLTRSRKAIPNVEGITRFEFDYAISSSGKTLPEWIDVQGLKTEETVSVSAAEGDHISVWLKAFDVIGNTREDSVKIYLDSTSPVITYFGYSYQNMTGTSGTIRTDNDSIVQIFIDAHDDESGISLLQWQLLNMDEPSIVYGEADVRKTYPQDPDDEDCSPQTCNCLARDDLDLCFYTSYSIFLDLNTMTNVPRGETNCTFKILVYNNAMKQSEESLEFTIQHSIPMSTAKPGLGENSNQFDGGHAASVGIALGVLAGIAVIATVAVVSRYLIRRKNKTQDAKYEDKSKNSWTKWRMKFPTMDSLPRVKIAWR